MRSWLWSTALAGCGAAVAVPAPRFADAPAATRVDDRLDVPKPPATREFSPDVYAYDGVIAQPIARAFELRQPHRALGVNALDEVPDSTWFTNRIGVFALTPDEVRDGPVTDNPERHLPWTIHSTKVGGNSLGFIVKDSTGVKYVVKFDAIANPPEVETGTDVVVDRLLWACGYNVAEDQVVYIRPDDLVLERDASVKGIHGDHERRLGRAELARDLEKVHHEPDGRIRVMVSRWIDGKTLGGPPGIGVRRDDPNDRIPHELRRDLRGQAAIFAWLDAVDVTEAQYVDTWVADPKNPNRHYVKHYAVDFGMSLGAMAATDHDWWRGFAFRVDFGEMLRQLFTLGFAGRPWEERVAPELRGVAAMFEARIYDPERWHMDLATYTPFIISDRFDKYWGAKIIARFTRAQIRAAVEAGRFSDPRAIDYITDTLVARQRVTIAHWFARVNPLDNFAIDSSSGAHDLCFDDLAIVYGIAPAATMRYAISTYDFHAHPLDPAVVIAARPAGRTCAPLELAGDRYDYTIARIVTSRPGFTGETVVHVARDLESGAPRVIGVWRR